ncbi:MAG TPA: hypothetical protein VMD48_04595 [Solirubrobacteraceae bacterium]|nr:hypothetical protein [Solirubrobacteraceae bacterium]
MGVGSLRPVGIGPRDYRPPVQPSPTRRRLHLPRGSHRSVAIELAILAGFIAAGIVASWPRASYLAGRIPATRDAGSYVWGFWWIARQVEHLSNPWFTNYMAAPVGIRLGLHALMPLPGLVLMPITVIFGPSVSYNLLSIAMPGLLAYVTYRLARLWVSSRAGAIAAGAFLGLSSMMTWRSWYHLNLAAGVLFVPLVLEAAVRLTRRPGRRQAITLGVLGGCALLTDQEMWVLALLVAAATLAQWLVREPTSLKLRRAALAAITFLVVASPQLLAIVQQAAAGGATSPAEQLGSSYLGSAVGLPNLFASSPIDGALKHLGIAYSGRTGDGIPTFGIVVSGLAVLALVVTRRRWARLLGLLWLASATLALGPVLKLGGHTFIPFPIDLDGQRVSALMPYTWLVQIPGLSGFREASRFTMLGIVPAAVLAGTAVEWLRHRAPLAILPVVALGILDCGWHGTKTIGSVPTSLPAVDGPIAADHTRSIVVDVPYGIGGGTGNVGRGFDPDALVLATADGHPRAVAWASRVPAPTTTGLRADAFYVRLRAAQRGHQSNPAQLAAAMINARNLDIGWVVLWNWRYGQTSTVIGYVRATGFRLLRTADGIDLYRAAWNPAP